MKINTNLIRLITLHGFLRKSYFFIFTDGAIKKPEIYIKKEKNKRFKHLQTYYAQA